MKKLSITSVLTILIFFFLTPVQGLSRAEDYFKVAGKFSAISDAGAVMLRFTWIQDGQNYNIRIDHFLSSFNGQIEGNDDGVILKLSNQREPVISDDPNNLVSQYFGFSLPILSMKYWIRGVANPNGGWSATGKRNYRNYSIEQSNWDIEYLTYMKNLPGDEHLDLVPRKFIVQSAQTKIKMFIKYWNFSRPMTLK